MLSDRPETGKPENGRRGTALEPAELRRQIEFLTGIVATTEFQTAVQNLIDNPHQLPEANCAPRAYLTRWGVRVPEEVAVSLEGDPWFTFCNGTACVRVFFP